MSFWSCPSGGGTGIKPFRGWYCNFCWRRRWLLELLVVKACLLLAACCAGMLVQASGGRPAARPLPALTVLR